LGGVAKEHRRQGRPDQVRNVSATGGTRLIEGGKGRDGKWGRTVIMNGSTFLIILTVKTALFARIRKRKSLVLQIREPEGGKRFKGRQGVGELCE